MVEMLKMYLLVIPAGIIGVLLFSKLVDWMTDRVFSSPRLNNQLKMLLEEE